MTILLLGSRSQLGQSLIEEMQTRDIKYVATNSTELDVTDSCAMQAFFDQAKPEIVLNCSAYTSVDEAEVSRLKAYEVNVVGTRIITQNSKNHNATLVHISTDYVFSGEASEPWEVNSIREPVNYYGKTKALSEDVISMLYPERSYVFRTSGLYGQHRPNIVTHFAKLAKTPNMVAKAAENQFCQPTSTHDLAQRIMDCLVTKIPFGTYHATSSGYVSWLSFAQKIFQLSNASIDRVEAVKIESFNRLAKRPHYSVLSEMCWKNAGMPFMPNWETSLEKEFRRNQMFLKEVKRVGD